MHGWLSMCIHDNAMAAMLHNLMDTSYYKVLHTAVIPFYVVNTL